MDLKRKLFSWKALAFICLFLGSLGLLGISACGVDKDAKPRLSLPKDTHNFAKVSEDQTLTYKFAMLNTGRAPLKILEVDPDCACTVAKYDPSIPPGGRGVITLSIKPFSVLNAFQKNTTIRTNDPERPEVVLTLMGFSKPIIDIQPSHVVRLKGDPTKEVQTRLRLISHLPKPWNIRYFQTSIPDKIDVSLKTEEPGKVYIMDIKNKLKETGSYAGRIEIYNNFKERPRIILRVFGDFRVPLAKQSAKSPRQEQKAGKL
ncbi:MAG: DUF1573 domain-containing protein [Deltaproteobacteria bacterium]